MNFSTQIGNDGTSWKTFKEIAQTVDRGSWYTLYNYDHLVPPFAELAPHITDDLAAFEAGDVFEGWSMLAAFAALTERVRLGCLVTAMPFRNPALLAKMAATIDHISDGRFELGVGAAWHTGETRAYGIPLGTVKERLDRFAEGLEVLRLLLTPGPVRNFKGEYYQLDAAPFAPQPVQAKLPILIGGGGEKRTLRLVAEYADSYNFFGNFLGSKEIFANKCRVLDEHCEAIGRNPKEIRRTMALFADIEMDQNKAKGRSEFLGKNLDQAARDKLLFGTPQRIVDGAGEFLDMGIDEIIFCGLTQQPEVFQRFDEEVLAKLGRRAVTV
jgi:alkanesulfonate monooxygenase SsuD/methylene tetrahydromethanopterin reductase-like flavin-dependent oxidoreductase (luciferase family)